MIWISLIFPIIGAFIMLRWFRSHLAWWEIFIPIFASLLFTLIFKFTVEKIQVSDTEYWSSLIKKAEYYEPYTTWIHKTCSRTVKVGKSTTTVYYDCSYCEENGPEYKVHNTIGESFSISNSVYKDLMKRWKSIPKFVELNRDIDYHGSCGEDGDKYEIYWDQDPLTSEHTVTEHSYENRIQAAHTAFDFPEIYEIDKNLYKLFDYPKVKGFSQVSLLGADSIPWMTEEERNLGKKITEYMSGKWGPIKHGKIWILLFKDSPLTSALMQEAYWDGGNDNELVICIGLSSTSRDLQWVKPFSWTPNRKLLVDLREDIMSLKIYNIKEIQSVIDLNMDSFKRKDFKEFDYITVEPPTWAIITTIIISILLTFGLCYWAIVNDYRTDEDEVIKRMDRKIISYKQKMVDKWDSLVSKFKN
jgi:hypothetical protein